jgi:hypothetical protein
MQTGVARWRGGHETAPLVFFRYLRRQSSNRTSPDQAFVNPTTGHFVGWKGRITQQYADLRTHAFNCRLHYLLSNLNTIGNFTQAGTG